MDEYIDLLDQTIQRELLHGCTDEDFENNLSLSGNAREGFRDSSVELIRELQCDPELSVWYQSTIRNPYSRNNGLIDIYVDENEYEYWIDPEKDSLVQTNIAPDKYPKTREVRKKGPRTDVAPLREKALTLLERFVPSFGGRRTRLHPHEGNKDGQVYYFRWDDYSEPLPESKEAPFIQVGLFANGNLESFTNALSDPRELYA